MRVRLTCAIVGLFGIVVVQGCSEKQKEAARLEAAMKAGDTVMTSGIEQRVDTMPGQPEDSLNLVTSGQDAQSPTEISSDSKTGSNADSAGTTEANSGGSSDNTQVPATADTVATPEQVPDASAIPDEERLRQSKRTELSGQSAHAAGTGYVVQISSTPDQKEADTMAARFAKYGYRAFVTEAVVDGATYFRVRIGRYDTMTEAEGALSELNQKYKVSGFVAQVK